jgi:hypothetical protein
MSVVGVNVGDAGEEGIGCQGRWSRRLAELGKDSGVVEHLLNALASEVDSEARDSIIQAVARMKSPAAIPALAALIQDESTDGDTRWMAVESLGRIVRKRFLAQPQPVSAALEWLRQHHVGDEHQVVRRPR